MLKPKLSIIVPVYNVEKYLHRCVESLLSQTLQDIEIILVNDGSPDNCANICDEYLRKDTRVRVIHKENGGLSDARNVGIKIASGEYLMFVDSDDFIELDACYELYNVASKKFPEILVGGANKKIGSNEVKMEFTNSTCKTINTSYDFVKEQLTSKTMYMAAWMNIYRTDFIINNNLYFKNGIYHEDEEWTPRVLLTAENIGYSNRIFYNYIIRDNSITNTKNSRKNGIDLVNTCYELEKIYLKLEDNELMKLLNDYLVMLFLHAIHYGELYGKEFEKYHDKQFLSRNSISMKNKLKVFIFKLSPNLYKKINSQLKLV